MAGWTVRLAFPLFWLPALLSALWFLFVNRAIFRNPIVFVHNDHSFNRSVESIDFVSRLYFPHRISVVFFEQPGNNRYLPLCFDHNVDAFNRPPRGTFFIPELHAIRHRSVWFWVSLWASMRRDAHVINSDSVYLSTALAEGRLTASNEASKRAALYSDRTGYVRLLRDRIGRNPQLPADLLRQCRSAIEARHPQFFTRPLVTVMLRPKSTDQSHLNTEPRVADSQANYRPAIEHLAASGYHIAGIGEIDHGVFEGVPGYFSLEGIDLPSQLLELFLLMQCELFVGKQSGPHALLGSREVPCLICDAMPFWDGTLSDRDVILFKHIRDRKTDKRMSLVEAIRCPLRAYVTGLEADEFEAEANTSDEILQAVVESVEMLRGRLVLTEEDRLLWSRFSALSASEVTLRRRRNRTSLHILRGLRTELLGP